MQMSRACEGFLKFIIQYSYPILSRPVAYTNTDSPLFQGHMQLGAGPGYQELVRVVQP